MYLKILTGACSFTKILDGPHQAIARKVTVEVDVSTGGVNYTDGANVAQ